ncbi:hypothetical protein PVK06_048811 [Gossypium arboreum]|uniref:Uncharacterized protein n=1 Tax=Gossypium arboreum TaxID=29729 RepID=A0ABR0MHG9_GOSAR|nr:hypothetical protein PVK06_048811 [Gossypium arboreum]
MSINDEEGRLTSIKFTWLRKNFQYLLSSPMQMDIIYDARAFILQLISGILLSNVNQNKVHNNIGMFIPRALSSDKTVYENNGQLLPFTTIIGVLPNAISSISEPPTVCVATREQFLWMLYVEEGITAVIPSLVTELQQLFVSNVLLSHFHMVEWHDRGWVLRQFSCAQPILNPHVDIKEVHGMDKRVQVRTQ